MLGRSSLIRIPRPPLPTDHPKARDNFLPPVTPWTPQTPWTEPRDGRQNKTFPLLQSSAPSEILFLDVDGKDVEGNQRQHQKTWPPRTGKADLLAPLHVPSVKPAVVFGATSYPVYRDSPEKLPWAGAEHWPTLPKQHNIDVYNPRLPSRFGSPSLADERKQRMHHLREFSRQQARGGRTATPIFSQHEWFWTGGPLFPAFVAPHHTSSPGPRQVPRTPLMDMVLTA